MRESPWSKPKPHQKLFPKRIFFLKRRPHFRGSHGTKNGAGNWPLPPSHFVPKLTRGGPKWPQKRVPKTTPLLNAPDPQKWGHVNSNMVLKKLQMWCRDPSSTESRAPSSELPSSELRAPSLRAPSPEPRAPEPRAANSEPRAREARNF